MRAAILLSVLAIACSGSPSLRSGEGRAQVPGGSIWYEVVGKGPGVPLLLIHGGPGASSCYFEALRALGKDRPVIFYDQLGSGLSDRPSDTTLWRLPRFVDELDALRRHLGLRQVHILGHSWGGTIALEYVLSRGDSSVRSLILASPAVSLPRWASDARALLTQLPTPLQATIRQHEAAGTTSDPGYVAATDSFYARFLYSSGYPPRRTAACARRVFNDTVYQQMWGPSEFTPTGNLAAIDLSPDLGKLKLPLLWISGDRDEVPVPTLEEYHRLTLHSSIVVIPNAAHMTMVDQPLRYVSAIRAFLASTEAQR